jgi:hypothetical protein
LDKGNTVHKEEPPVRFGASLHQIYTNGALRCALGVFGILLFRRVCFEGILHSAGGCVSHAQHDVGVGIEGERYVGVSWKLLDELGMYALAE